MTLWTDIPYFILYNILDNADKLIIHINLLAACFVYIHENTIHAIKS